MNEKWKGREGGRGEGMAEGQFVLHRTRNRHVTRKVVLSLISGATRSLPPLLSQAFTRRGRPNNV